MSVLKTKDLLDQLSQLESSLKEFSFEELNTLEAAELSSSFKSFKHKLEENIYNPNRSEKSDSEHTDVSDEQSENSEKSEEYNLIAHVSHEIRTPLNGIIGFTNLLKEEGLNSKQLIKVNAIQSASHTLMEVINEVLEFSKLTSGADDLNTIDFNFQGLIQDVTFLCQTLIMDSKVKLDVKIDPKIPKTLVGDPSKLSQILLNLLGNAIKFVEKGYVKFEITLGEKSKNTFTLNFSIQDTGIGIPEEQLPHIFESYKQADNNTFAKYGGSGLGLSIVKEIVKKQGGQITVTSKVGKGTTFKFSLPFEKGSRTNIPKEVLNTINVQKGKELLGGTRILVFEDNLLNQHLISEQLNKWGCKVYVTADAQNGMHLLKTQAIDLVLMDLKMPVMNGFEISKKIRSHKIKNISQVPIIALSADFTANDKDSCITAGINDFLLKPYTLDELLIKLKKNKKGKALTKESESLLKTETISNQNTDTIDLNAVLKDCFGEIEMLEELVRLFKQNVFEFIGAVKIHLSHNDLKEVSLAAHKLKAGLALMKALHLKEIIVAIELSCKEENAGEVSRLFEEFLDAYPQNEITINKGLAKIKNS